MHEAFDYDLIAALEKNNLINSSFVFIILHLELNQQTHLSNAKYDQNHPSCVYETLVVSQLNLSIKLIHVHHLAFRTHAAVDSFAERHKDNEDHK